MPSNSLWSFLFALVVAVGSVRSQDAEMLALVEQAVADEKCVGLSVAVMRGDQWLIAGGFGMAELEHQVPVRDDSMFRIGSTTKQFTAAAVMKLVEQGKIELDADFRDYLPDYPEQQKTVTVRHLLTHTSGIPSYTGMQAWQPKVPLELSHDELLEFFRDDDLEFEPGTDFKYNNSGYYLLGLLLEKVTGESYAEHLRKALFEPLGLTHTRYGSNEELIAHRAQGYQLLDGELANDALIGMSQPGAAGALLSTAEELVRWARALAAGEVVSADSYALMTTPYTLADGKDSGYGFGLMIGSLGKVPQVAHGGGINGFNSYLAHYPEQNVTVAVISNCEVCSSSVLAKRLARKALQIAEPTVNDLALGEQALQFLVGDYAIQDGQQSVKVVADGGVVALERSNGRTTRLLAQADKEFLAADNPEVRIVFAGEGSHASGFTVQVEGTTVQRGTWKGDAGAIEAAAASQPTLGEPTAVGDLPVTQRLPVGWVAEETTSSMRLAQYRIGSESERLCVVYWFGVGSGGGKDANFDRWTMQFDFEAEIAEEDIEIAEGIRASVLDVHGTYVAEVQPGEPGRHNEADWIMLAAYVEVPEGPLYLKLVGPAAEIAPQRAAFGAWVRSFRAQ